ncbi:MAG: HAMP domain-containing sensor histidine kinase [Candidatus Omnitrophica bacterium]|nr:HAMP domain-containing sensor histidine kinase [Candidatus Omnitrophota bacterium]
MNSFNHSNTVTDPGFKEKVRALTIFSYTAWALVVPFFLLSFWIYSMGYPLSIGVISYLAAALFLLGVLHLALSRFAWTKNLVNCWCWTFSIGISVLETLIVFFTGGILSPFVWIYLITIYGETYFLSPRRGMQIVMLDGFLFNSMIILQVFDQLPRTFSVVADFDPYASPPFLVTHVLSYLALYLAASTIFAMIVHRLREDRVKLSSINEELKENQSSISELLVKSKRREAELEGANRDLLRVRAALFNIMDDIEDANKKMTKRSAELELKSAQLEALTNDLLKQRTELLTITRALEQANLELSHLDRIKSDFVTVISEELRVPLAVVREKIHLVKNEIANRLGGGELRAMEELEQNAARMGVLVDDILDLFQVESGRMKISKISVRLADVIREAVSSATALCEEKKIRLECEIPDNLPPVFADRERIIQVLGHLIENGLKFTNAGGFVRVVSFRESGSDYVEVCVMDNGMGIAPEDMGKLFGKFQRMTKMGKDSFGGTGVGLYISKQIIERHQGRIWAESKLGEGSRFYFTLPVHHPELPLGEELDEFLDEARLGGLTVVVLVVEILNAAEIEKLLGTERSERFYLELAEEIRRNISSRDKISFEKEGRSFYIFAFSKPDGAKKMRLRIETALLGVRVPAEGKELRLNFKAASAVFPHDGLERRSLLERVAKRLRGESE